MIFKVYEKLIEFSRYVSKPWQETIQRFKEYASGFLLGKKRWLLFSKYKSYI